MQRLLCTQLLKYRRPPLDLIGSRPQESTMEPRQRLRQTGNARAAHLGEQAGGRQQRHGVEGGQLCARLLQQRLGADLDGPLHAVQAVYGVPYLVRGHMPHYGAHLQQWECMLKMLARRKQTVHRLASLEALQVVPDVPCLMCCHMPNYGAYLQQA